MSDDLNMPASGFMEQHIKQRNEGAGAKAGCVEVLCICVVEVAVEQLHMLLVVLCKLVDVAIRPDTQTTLSALTVTLDLW